MPAILVIDDEPENVELMARRLSRRGFTVRGAAAAAGEAKPPPGRTGRT
jgi:CheY-like chemotaxis protein